MWLPPVALHGGSAIGVVDEVVVAGVGAALAITTTIVGCNASAATTTSTMTINTAGTTVTARAPLLVLLL